MVKLYDEGIFLLNGKDIVPASAAKQNPALDPDQAKKGTIAYSILKAHNTTDDMEHLKERFDAMTSHDITYVGIIQTARASGLETFPLPYVLTNCHNSLCAVGGTINEDDHVFGLSAAKKYGGIFVPPHMAVIHQYMREMMAGCGKMILGSDSHTRYGALGTMAIGEGGGELVKQLLKDTYDIDYPGVIAIYLTGRPMPGVGPHDIALAIEKEVFANGYVKNKVMEFVGPGVASMSTDFRNSVDVMTTETTCLSSIWRTDEETRRYLALHGRENDYRQLDPADVAYYDGCVEVDLSTIKPMIALPFHPSNVYEIEELNENAEDIFHEIDEHAKELTGNPNIHFSLSEKIKDGKIHVQQGIIAGCSGGNYSNVMAAAHIMKNAQVGNDVFNVSVYPSSQPVFMDLMNKGAIYELMKSGAAVKTAFCGPCFGAGDTPANNEFSIRHTTRNFPNREGSKPGNDQLAAVALMDARSIAATAVNHGVLTPATAFADDYEVPEDDFDPSVYQSRIYDGFDAPKPETELVYGPNIKDWPAMEPLADNILLRVDAKIMDAVTTTDELIPSGETSSYRSNPLGLAEFTLSRRDPKYVGRAKATRALEESRTNGTLPALETVYEQIKAITPDVDPKTIEIGSMIYAVKPGDGSAREQAASCQRVLGGLANICTEYATKRYRSNVINWGMIPFQMKEEPKFEIGDYIYVPNIRQALHGDMKQIKAYVLGKEMELNLYIAEMTEHEKEIVEAGCLINYNRNK
ncbi:hydratase [Catenisphaera adipataccumulans]|uniref:Aconitate hydratase n=1 Tax=Catenisphaera adipataccumulans TaxID=700500 RepID=A0A7W8CXV5_9FIRM|nr:hydratase [Catenisphaera adipataccumulans]MBB5183630.1 aconitate hydratase [Catenisphaera adipataccumulans]